MSIFDYFDAKYKNRKDKDNMFGVGISDEDFRRFIIDYLLGENWYVAEPLDQEQINEIALREILEEFSKRYKKENKRRILL